MDIGIAGRKAIISAPQSTTAAKPFNLHPTVAPAAVAMTDVAPILHHALLNALVGEIGIECVRETVTVFLAETVEGLALLRKLSCDNDRTRIKNEAHTLKGAAGTFGLGQVAELTRTLELSAHRIAPRDYGDLLDRLDVCFSASRNELTAAMTETVASPSLAT